MPPEYEPQHGSAVPRRCRPSIQWRVDGRLFAVCRQCPRMSDTSRYLTGTYALFGCRAQELDD